jgi:hypothetical protein
LQVNVCAANFRKFDSKDSRVKFEIRQRYFAEFNCMVWLRNDSGDWHGGDSNTDRWSVGDEGTDAR